MYVLRLTNAIGFQKQLSKFVKSLVVVGVTMKAIHHTKQPP